MESENNAIRVKHVAFSDINGGAARAAYRVHQSLVNNFSKKEIISSMRVIRKYSNDPNVIGGPANSNHINYFKQRALNKCLRKIYNFKIKTPFSAAWPSSGLAKELNKDYLFKKFDLINLHWLGDLTLSIKEIGDLQMPLTWRLADQWPIFGCEHYLGNDFDFDSIKNQFPYIKNKKEIFKNLLKFDFKSFQTYLKLKYWKKPIHIIAPTNWIAKCVKESQLFEDSYISVINTPLDLDKWSPINKNKAKSELFLPLNKKIILFGAIGGLADKRKGGDLLIKTFLKMKNLDNLFFDKYEILVFGAESKVDEALKNLKVKFVGRLDDISLRLHYSAADLFVLPSREDNLPGTGLESMACGTPVVAFNTCGLTDIIDHHVNGALAKPFDCDSMAYEINWTLLNEKRMIQLSKNSRKKAVEKWSQEKISRMYYEHYLHIMDLKI